MRTFVVLLSLVVVGAFGRGILRAANNPTVCDPNVKQYAGYFEIDATTQKKYFYWAFSSRSNPSTDPVVMWMTGGNVGTTVFVGDATRATAVLWVNRATKECMYTTGGGTSRLYRCSMW